MAASNDWLSVGKVGVQGPGRAADQPASDFPELHGRGPVLRSNRGGEPTEIQLEKGRQLPGKSIFVVRFDGVDNRSGAEALVGQELLVPADDRPDLAEGEFHLLDLVGLEARLIADGPAIGTVSDLISGGNDLLEVTTTDGRKLLIPFVEAIVPEVQLEAGWLLLTPPPGLLEL